MLAAAFIIFLSAVILTWPMFTIERMAVAALLSGGVLVVGMMLSAALESAGYAATMLLRTLTVYLPGWTSALMMARLITSANGVPPTEAARADASPSHGLLIVALIGAALVLTLLAVDSDPMTKSSGFTYNSKHYVGVCATFNTSATFYEDLCPFMSTTPR